MFIQSINPLHVVSVQNNSLLFESNNVNVATVSFKAPVETGWNYGHIHGGTPAQLLQECDCYLSFFHSKGFLSGNALSTYFAGAFTFTKDPPFRLLSISPFPIVARSLYQGPWVPFHNRYLGKA